MDESRRNSISLSGSHKKTSRGKQPSRTESHLSTTTVAEGEVNRFDYTVCTRSQLAILTPLRAALAMMIVLEQQHQKRPMIPERQFEHPPDHSLDDSKLVNIENKIVELERKLKQVSRRLKECRRNQLLLKERAEALKSSIYKSQQLAVVERLVNTVPTEKDIEALEKMKQFEAHRSKVNRQMKNEKLQNKVLAKTLERTEIMLAESPIFKIKKRAVIVEDEPLNVLVKHSPSFFLRKLERLPLEDLPGLVLSGNEDEKEKRRSELEETVKLAIDELKTVPKLEDEEGSSCKESKADSLPDEESNIETPVDVVDKSVATADGESKPETAGSDLMQTETTSGDESNIETSIEVEDKNVATDDEVK